MLNKIFFKTAICESLILRKTYLAIQNSREKVSEASCGKFT